MNLYEKMYLFFNCPILLNSMNLTQQEGGKPPICDSQVPYLLRKPGSCDSPVLRKPGSRDSPVLRKPGSCDSPVHRKPGSHDSPVLRKPGSRTFEPVEQLPGTLETGESRLPGT